MKSLTEVAFHVIIKEGTYNEKSKKRQSSRTYL